jgi:dTDP-glucose pyrophosphorylase
LVGGELGFLYFRRKMPAPRAIDEIVIVVSAFTEGVINTYGSSYRGVPITYKIQNEPKGLVHAIECAAGALGESDFVLMLADEIVIDASLPAMVERFQRDSLFAVLGVVTVDDPSHISKTYSILEDSVTGQIHRLIEKPRRPHNNVMGTGHCVFRSAMLSYIDMCPINQTRGEKELPDLVQCAIDDGHPVKTHRVGSRYINVNASDDFREAYDLLASYATRL